MTTRQFPGSQPAANVAALDVNNPARWLPTIPTPLNPRDYLAWEIARSERDAWARYIADALLEGRPPADLELALANYRYFVDFINVNMYDDTTTTTETD